MNLEATQGNDRNMDRSSTTQSSTTQSSTESTMDELIQDLQRRKAKAAQMGGDAKVAAQHALGRYTARERVDKLVDHGSFLELGILNHSDVPGAVEKSPADGLIAGIAKVDGRLVVVEASDKTVFAGTEGTVFMRKAEQVHNFAVKRGLPIFHLGEGGGLRIPDGMGADGISEKMMPMTLLRHNRAVPTMAAILGDSFGGPTWTAVTSDFAAQVKGTAMAVAGPRMLEIATGETVSDEELGGWKVHAEQTGQIDAFADDENACIALMKRFFSYMPSHAGEEPAVLSTADTGDSPDRRLDNVDALVPTRKTRAYDMRRLVRAVVDHDSFFELKPYFGAALITGLGRLNGRVVGVLANQPLVKAGAAGPDECDKATEFICLCDSYHIPLVFLHDIPGFRVGSAAEHRKIATKIMVWNQALAWSTVPKVSVVIRKSIGAAYGNMCGPGMGADFVVAWPTAEISFTGADVGVNVVYGRELANVADKAEAAAMRQQLVQQWEIDSSPYKAAAKHLLDDVIDPRDTRRFLCRVLEAACTQHGARSERRLANWPTGF
ncbi:acetyl-CoA carboxylase carboxyltransferase component [Alicyclobacillus cycloheptanicus]|uniref:Acetyl-CoA carboxylase carboxyltransferase component n=2 Tax=Alicyclobacillus cycloheptanicus TaxID=1457 RepID=A0ABT9XFS7_9BACL|nr:acetyl-CoA carboxylase carboxyltransferase component [Alicyclobacillus cycloheptanicus]